MARLLQLETFDLQDGGRSAYLAEGQLADLKLQSYEQGYQAGWDDALGAQAEDIARLRTELGHNLTEMALSYRDARRHVLASLEPLLAEMVAKVLPMIAHQSLGHVILDEIRPFADALSGAPLLVRTAPVNRDLVERLLQAEAGLPVTVEAEPTLGDGQAYLKIAGTEVSVDLDGLIGAIAEAVTSFFHTERNPTEGKEASE